MNHLRLKITVGTALILGGFLLLLGVYMVNSQEEQLVNNLRDHGNRIASLAARSSAEYIQRFSFFLMEDQAMSIEQSPHISFCEIFDADGNPLLQSGNIVSKDHTAKRTARYGEGIMVVSQPIMAAGDTLGRVEIGLQLGSIEAAIRDKTRQLTLVFSGFTLCVVIVLNLFFQKVFTSPVLRLTEGARKVARQEFVTIDVGERSDELGQLAKNFNAMSRRLEGLYANLEGMVHDRTRALEQANAELVKAVARAKEMAKKAEEGTLAKSQFLASMSHEIRTPMNAVLGMGEILNGSELTDEQRRYVSILLESGNSLLGLIDDILDLSKIEAGEMVFESTPFMLEEVVDKAFKVTAYAGHQKGLDLEFMIAPDVPARLSGDPHRLQQILINLIGNGVKFTDEGSVLLDVRLDPDGLPLSKGPTMIRFLVRDTGIGIPGDKIDTIFEKFTQADASTTRRHGGTGLGLSICRLLCEKLGGRIWIESEAGRGCSVFFSLPYQAAEDQKAGVSILKGASSLLVDGRPYAAEALAARMTMAGARVELCAGLPEGRQSWIGSGGGYDAVLVDVPVDGEDWESATTTLVEAGVDPGKIVLTAPSNAARVSPSHPFGGVLTKPVSVGDVESALADMAERNVFRNGPVAVSAAGNKPLNILLMEDSMANSMLVELYLKDSDHRLLVAENGAKGLEMFKTEPVDIVFMDIEMPVMDGIECTRVIREWERANGREPVVIVALTAHALSEVRERVKAAGCDSFLTKPITRRDFLQAVGLG